MARKKNKYGVTLLQALKANEPEFLPPTVSYRAQIEWRDGEPHLVSAPERISPQPENSLKALMKKCLDLPYSGDDPSLQGMSQGEAMMINLMRSASDGDMGAITTIIDRLLGRPTSNNINTNLSGDLNAFLDKVAADTKITTIEITPEKPEQDLSDL